MVLVVNGRGRGGWYPRCLGVKCCMAECVCLNNLDFTRCLLGVYDVDCVCRISVISNYMCGICASLTTNTLGKFSPRRHSRCRRHRRQIETLNLTGLLDVGVMCSHKKHTTINSHTTPTPCPLCINGDIVQRERCLSLTTIAMV